MKYFHFFLCFRKLRFLTQGKIIINMSIALIGVYTCYMIAVNAKAIRDARTIRGDILCGFFGALLYYFLLVYFMWTGLEAIDLYRKLVKVFTKGNKRLMIYGGIICWGEKSCNNYDIVFIYYSKSKLYNIYTIIIT